MYNRFAISIQKGEHHPPPMAGNNGAKQKQEMRDREKWKLIVFVLTIVLTTEQQQQSTRNRSHKAQRRIVNMKIDSQFTESSSALLLMENFPRDFPRLVSLRQTNDLCDCCLSRYRCCVLAFRLSVVLSIQFLCRENVELLSKELTTMKNGKKIWRKWIKCNENDRWFSASNSLFPFFINSRAIKRLKVILTLMKMLFLELIIITFDVDMLPRTNI